MKREKVLLNENDRLFRSVTLKIGIAMILQYVMFLGFNILTAILSEILSVLLSSVFLNEEIGYVLSEILSMVAYLAAFLVPAWILYKMLGKHAVSFAKEEKAMPKNALPLTISVVAINFAASYFNQLLVNALIPIPDTSAIYPSEPMTVWYQYVLLLLSTAVVPAICEEILFRGVVLKNLIPFGRGTAILASAILFGLMHGNVMQFFYTTLLGIAVGYIYVHTRSLWLCMLIHFVNNGVGVLQESVDSLADQNLSLQINSGITVFVMVLGAISLVLLSVFGRQKPKPEEEGSFGVVYEPTLEYEEYPVTPKRKWSLFFSPTIIVFFVISGISIVNSLIGILSLWIVV